MGLSQAVSSTCRLRSTPLLLLALIFLWPSSGQAVADIAPESDWGPGCTPLLRRAFGSSTQYLTAHRDMPFVIPVYIDDLAAAQAQVSELVTVMNEGLALFTGTTSIWVNPTGNSFGLHFLVWTPEQPLAAGEYELSIDTLDEMPMCERWFTQKAIVLDEDLGDWP